MKKILNKFLKLSLAFMMAGALFTSCSHDDQSSKEVSKVTITAENDKTVLRAGETVQLTATPASPNYIWSSSKSTVARVSATGLVTVANPIPAAIELPYTVKISVLNSVSNETGDIEFTIEETWEDKINAAKYPVSLSALNCRSDLDFNSNGELTDMAVPDALSNSDDAYAYAVYPVEINKKSNITLECRINYAATTNTNGPALIMHNGKKVVSYRALTDQGIKNIVVDADAAAGDQIKTGGNGLTYNTGHDASELINNTVIAKVNVANGSIAMAYYTLSGTLIANKQNTFDSIFTDTAKVYLAVGGNQTEKMSVSDIYITEDSKKQLVTKIDNAGLAGLTIATSSIRIKLGGSETVDVVSVAPGGAVAKATASSADTTKVTVAVADPDADGISKLTLNGVGKGSTTITVIHADDSSLKRTILVSVDDFSVSDPYASLDCYPASGATAAYEDGWFRLAFDETPQIMSGGAIMIYDYESGNLVDTILFSEEKLTVWSGVTLAVRDQLAYVDGTNLYFMPHYGALKNDTKYFVAFPKASVNGKIGGVNFYDNGLSNVSKSWSFTVRPAHAAISDGAVLNVNNSESDTTADFRTVYAAMYACKDVSGSVTINVAPGTYNELDYYKGTANLTIAGTAGTDHGAGTLLTWNNYEKMNSGTHNRAQFYINGSNLVLKNLSFVNKFRRNASEQEGQAECIYFAGGNDKKLVAYNCSFVSYQDTIQSTGRNWFYDCYIAGDVDFLWGTADAALFENCKLHTLKDENRTNDTADLLVPRVANKAAAKIGKGYVVFNSTIEVDEGIKQSWGRVAGTGDFYDQCAVINTNVTGAGLIDGFWNAGTAPVGLDKVAGVQHVGWKDYGVTVNGTAVNSSTRLNKAFCGTITEAVYNAEYKTRDQILNRVYNKSTGAYEVSANGAWDVSSYYSEFGITE